MRVGASSFMFAGAHSAGLINLFADPDVKSFGIRMRLQDFVLDAKRVAALKRGVAVMKSRKPSDPRSWFFQAAIHGVLPTAVEEAQKTDPDIKKIDQNRFWNQCPHFPGLHLSSANFPIWHRAYVYYFERILRDASQDASLSLPYWDYTDPAQRSFPDILSNAEPDDSGKPTNPLYDARRENAFVNGYLDLSEKAVSTAAALGQPKFFGNTASDGFAGAANDLEPEGQGLLEISPHNHVHFAIGGFIAADAAGNLPAGEGLMSEVETAAFDPVFWIHHCNIDRLWSVWDAMPNRTWGNAPSSAWFNEKPWWFHDYDGSVQNKERGFYVKFGNLEIAFDTDNAGATRLSAKLPEPTRPLLLMTGRQTEASQKLSAHVPEQIEIGSLSEPLTLMSTAPVSKSISLDFPKRLGANNARDALLMTPPKVERRIYVELSGIHYEQAPSVGYEIFIDSPKESQPAAIDSRHRVGALGLFGIKHAQSGHENGHSQVFDVSEALKTQTPTDHSLRFTVVPFPLLVPKESFKASPAEVPLRSGGVSVSKIRVFAAQVEKGLLQ